MATHQLRILLVENKAGTAATIQGLWHQQGFTPPLLVARNGQEALHLLQGTAGQAPLRQPCLLLLTLALADMSGLELLRALRRDLELRRLIVFVLSDLATGADKQAVYAQQAAGYLPTAQLAQRLPLLGALLHCYQTLVEFPV